MRLLSEKIKSMLQSKQSDQLDTLRLTHVYYLRSVVFVVNAFFQIPSSSFRKKLKEDENEEKTIDGLQKMLKQM